MTPQEAKKMLKAKLECLKRETSGTDIDCNHRNCDECNLCYEQGNMGEQKEALDMAIKALEQQPCEDCISREDVLEWVDESLRQYGGTYSTDMLNMWGLFKDWIGKMPPVTPKARWIPIKTRPMTEEEKEEIGHEYAFMYDCPLPDDGQDVLITDCYGNVEVDIFCNSHQEALNAGVGYKKVWAVTYKTKKKKVRVKVPIYEKGAGHG